MWLDDHFECELADKEWCETNEGHFQECGSRCRHEDEESICTMECVVYCDFSAVDDRERCLSE